MVSKLGMFDAIKELREETNHLNDLIGSRMTNTLWHLYTKTKTKKEFKEKAKNLLNW